MTNLLEIRERFWSKVKILGPDDCWEWQASKDINGYGRFYVNGSVTKAHRVAHLLAKGEIPRDKMGLHSCDNPGCCNPKHVAPGTCSDNVKDCVAKGRHKSYSGGTPQPGESNPNSKLTEDKVRQIRTCGLSLKATAKLFGVGQTIVSYIRNGKAWKHVSP